MWLKANGNDCMIANGKQFYDWMWLVALFLCQKF